MCNIPNILTLIRLVLIPAFIVLFYMPSDLSNFYAAIVFVIAAFTDFLDGYLARRMRLTTKFGSFFDPVADKIIVCTALVLIVEHYSLYRDVLYPHLGKFITIPAMIIVAREITVSALREWMAELGKRSNVAVSMVGKWKTTIQLVAISGLIWRYNECMIYVGVFALIIATVLTIWSLMIYMKAAFVLMKEDIQ
ncbi:CDP-diacylglycerol--glycerol-3-phosphate 3-phosphatidyltransferase [Succinivibrio dextrinosolvens]|uniref:CDP-diacylglycerol--glycerol-3-phosphate 3-phosphatidyltransferase n=1 Tax=Succinivibrio dextrinosolvens TaxID=83771 RepID=UPI00241C0FC8|nr:CDP-diacylglycerol--glycerol-3-phosphate 3-phosphatidyltransferase [Succinivibrio dextrinosolvens]MBE6423892.1 CDP-diacylglycerol--glycerol-3-phosphate 3-phosphatidyltransferase [Succinivibrio dextrinosolvens]